MPRLTNICVFLACVLMLYSATYLSNPVPRRRAQPSVDPGEVPAATDDEIARVRRQLDEAQRREERARELLRATQEQASRTGPAPVVPVAVPAVVPSGPSERPAAAARQVNAGIVLDGTLEAALGLAAPRGPGFLMLTFSNSALKDHLYNFVAHAKEVAAALVRVSPNPNPNPNPARAAARYLAALNSLGVLGVNLADVVHAPDERQARGDQHRDRHSPEALEHLQASYDV